jgi:acetoin utilization protein AcuB
MKVSKYMSTKLITAAPEMSVLAAFSTMRSFRVRHLPVVDKGELVGIISDRDLRRPRWAEEVENWADYYRLDEETTVADVMTRTPQVVRTYDRIDKAVKLFREHRYGALPVLDKKGELHGIISPHDLLGALENCLAKCGGKGAK